MFSSSSLSTLLLVSTTSTSSLALLATVLTTETASSVALVVLLVAASDTLSSFFSIICSLLSFLSVSLSSSFLDILAYATTANKRARIKATIIIFFLLFSSFISFLILGLTLLGVVLLALAIFLLLFSIIVPPNYFDLHFNHIYKVKKSQANLHRLTYMFTFFYAVSHQSDC